ncbi:MAG: hypothetical protein JWL59_1130 [Chthoniobacteraceae bacterium]|nr:hypothetical protein [Chthoniobacteraceae bacterium]
MIHFFSRRLVWTFLFIISVASADTGVIPPNVGGGLERLVERYQSNSQTTADRKGRMQKDAPIASGARVDGEQAVVDIRLDGSRPLAQVQAALVALGINVLATHEVAGPGSTISAKIPLGSVVTAARTPGVFSIVLVHRPIKRVGRTTTQGAALLKTVAVNSRGFTGEGITVGVISDSFDVSFPPAANDVASGDLPGPGNPLNNEPVKVLTEGDPATGEDEGRAMLQIIHDIAPKARLVFTTSGETPATFAQGVLALRTTGKCDIIVDDIGYPDEPFFSDGIASQAVDDAVHSSELPGKKVLYYSSAGNDGNLGFADDFRPISDANVRARLVPNNLKLSRVPVTLTAGGFHNFAKAGKPVVVQHVKATGGMTLLDFQWDDPFLPGSITTDYNVLVFDARGNFRPDLSGLDENVSVGQAIEFASIPVSRTGSGYQIAITRRALGTQEATHLRYLAHTNGGFDSDYRELNAVTLFGHAGAPGGDGVGAYDYRNPLVPEPFSSFGPLTIYFNRAGRRLSSPEVRQQPSISAPDNVNTTFFPGPFSDVDEDGFPNFSGTSAAAPHAAGVAALLLQAAGGPGSATALQIRSALQESAVSHDLDPSFSKASIQTSDSATVTLTATGGGDNASANDPHFFHLSFEAPADYILQRVTIDLAPAGLKFDPSARLGYPFRLGGFTGVKRSQIKAAFSGQGKTTLTLTFRGGTFLPGVAIDFGVDRDEFELRAAGNSADLLTGATVTIQTLSGAITTDATGTFENLRGDGFSPADGFGLIDAEAALDRLVP